MAKTPAKPKQKQQTGKSKNPVGRPRKEVDWELLDQLCAIQCTEVEIAAILKIHPEELTRKIKAATGMNFPQYFAEKSADGKRSLRRRQFQVALGAKAVLDRETRQIVEDAIAPNTTMLIWLGKQYLNQSDKRELSGKDGLPLKIQYEVVDANS